MHDSKTVVQPHVITQIKFNLSPTDLPPLMTKEVDLRPILERALCSVYPDLFTNKGRKKPTKLLHLVTILLEERVNNTEPGSLSEYAKRLGWKRKSRGKVSQMFKQLEKIELASGRRLNDGFFLKLFGDTCQKVAEIKDIFEASRVLLGLIPTAQLDPTSLVNSGFGFTNIGQVVTALEFVLNEAAEGDDLFLILKEGETWGSEGIGDLMRFFLERAVKQKKLKLHVLTTPKMNKDLLDFFKGLEAIIAIDDTLLDKIGNLRYFYVADYVITVNKSEGVGDKAIFSGNLRRIWLNNNKKVIKKRFQKLLEFQRGVVS